VPDSLASCDDPQRKGKNGYKGKGAVTSLEILAHAISRYGVVHITHHSTPQQTAHQHNTLSPMAIRVYLQWPRAQPSFSLPYYLE